MVMTGGRAIMGGDSSGYIMPAKHIIENAFFSNDGVNPAYLRTPGYPLFLAAVYFLGGNDTAVVIAQILLLTLKLYLFYRILIMLDVPQNLSVLGTTLLLFDVQSYGYSFAIMTEPLFGFFLILSLYFLVKYIYRGRKLRMFFAFAAAFNYALLIRPILVYFCMLVCAVLFLAFLARKINRSCFALFALCFVLVFGGWSLRNYVHSGVFIFSTIQKSNMKNCYAPIVSAGSEYVKTHDVQGFIEGASDYHEQRFLREYPEIESGNLNEARISILQGEYGMRFIKANFAEYIKVNIIGLLKMMLTSFQTALLYESTSMSTKRIVVGIIQWLYLIYICAIYALYVAGLPGIFKKRDALQISIFLLCGYLAAAGAIFGSVRFRYPFFPLLVLGAVVSGKFIMQWVLSKSKILLLNRFGRFLLDDDRIKD
jgi:4-amino-4-deoxy-L-arabinose transferase-like glycosyltransferase